jgi:hypothetical protein
MTFTFEQAKLIASNTGGKLSADDVMNLATYGTTNAMDMAPEEVGEGCLCGVKNCPDEYDHVTHGV